MIEYYRDRFRDVRARPRMWLADDTFASHVDFATGVDVGTRGELLRGFRDFLLAKLGRESSYTEWAIVLSLTEPTGDKDLAAGDLPEPLRTDAIEKWYDLLEEYLATSLNDVPAVQQQSTAAGPPEPPLIRPADGV